MWIENPTELFSVDIYPLRSDNMSQFCNKLTRMLLIVVIIMACLSYNYIHIGIILGVGLVAIILIYVATFKKENFSPLSYKMDTMVPSEEIPNHPTTPFVEHKKNIPPTDNLSTTQINNMISSMSNGAKEPSVFSPMGLLQPKHTSTNTEQIGHTIISNLLSRSHENNTSIPTKGYFTTQTQQPRATQEYFTPDVGTNTRMYQEPVMIAPRIMDAQFASVETNFPVDANPLQNFGGMSMPVNIPRRPNLMMAREKGETDLSENQLRKDRTYLSDIQPHAYSTTNERLPINANLGISSTPQLPSLSKKMFRGNDGRNYPLYSRIDPQLIREDVPEQRRQELPRRNDWSDDLPQPATGNPVYDVYDPRFTGYGDQSRSYFDTNMGQVKYYYGDVDAYRQPNFVIRNKVDHVSLTEPMGKTYSMYPRTASLEDVQDQVNDDWLAKSTEHREDIMEKLMRKNNSESWQLRYAPHSKGARLSSFTSGY